MPVPCITWLIPRVMWMLCWCSECQEIEINEVWIDFSGLMFISDLVKIRQLFETL